MLIRSSRLQLSRRLRWPLSGPTCPRGPSEQLMSVGPAGRDESTAPAVTSTCLIYFVWVGLILVRRLARLIRRALEPARGVCTSPISGTRAHDFPGATLRNPGPKLSSLDRSHPEATPARSPPTSQSPCRLHASLSSQFETGSVSCGAATLAFLCKLPSYRVPQLLTEFPWSPPCWAGRATGGRTGNPYEHIHPPRRGSLHVILYFLPAFSICFGYHTSQIHSPLLSSIHLLYMLL